ncbi:hypothetical protein DFH94DRAFT_777460, partial [Russula ochroleuca]
MPNFRHLAVVVCGTVSSAARTVDNRAIEFSLTIQDSVQNGMKPSTITCCEITCEDRLSIDVRSVILPTAPPPLPLSTLTESVNRAEKRLKFSADAAPQRPPKSAQPSPPYKIIAALNAANLLGLPNETTSQQHPSPTSTLSPLDDDVNSQRRCGGAIHSGKGKMQGSCLNI